MWRLFIGIPRAIRQQIHSSVHQRAACIDDECKSTVPCNQTSQLPLVVTGSRRYSSGHENEGSKQGPDREKHHWRKPHFDFWFHLQQGHHCALEAVGWGAAVVLGIHLSKLSNRPIESWDSAEQRHFRHCLWYRVAYSLPQLPGSTTQKTVLPQHSTPKPTPKPRAEKVQVDASQAESAEPNALDVAFGEFEDMCWKYCGMGKNIAGVQQASENNMGSAIHHWKEASYFGCAKAQFNLGLCYESGSGIEQNISEAVKYYKLASHSGHSEALYNLALLYRKGEHGVEQNIPEALILLEKAAELGLRQAQTYLGVYYTEEEKQDMAKAVSLFKAAAAQSDPEAQYFLGICYEQGWGIEQNECKAAELYSQASKTGHDGALYNLAVFHEYGLGGLPINLVTAQGLYEKASEAGNENAQHSLERLHAEDATADWNRQEFARHVAEQTIQEATTYLRSYASSPTLTDYLRQHLEKLTLNPATTAGGDAHKPDVNSWIQFNTMILGRQWPAMKEAEVPKFTIGPVDDDEVVEFGMNPAPRAAFTGANLAGVNGTQMWSHPSLSRPASLFDLNVACT